MRSESARAVVLLRDARRAVPALIEAVRASTDAAWTRQLVGALGKLADERSGAVLIEVLADRKRYGSKARELAARGLGTIVHVPAVPALMAAVADRSKPVRKAAAAGLLMITAHDFRTGRSAASRWRRWWRRNAKRTRIEWIRAGFARHHKIRISRRTRERAIAALVDRIQDGGAWGLNARVLIEDLTGHAMTQGHFSDRQMFRFYRTWLRSRAKRRPKR